MRLCDGQMLLGWQVGRNREGSNSRTTRNAWNSMKITHSDYSGDCSLFLTLGFSCLNVTYNVIFALLADGPITAPARPANTPATPHAPFRKIVVQLLLNHNLPLSYSTGWKDATICSVINAWRPRETMQSESNKHCEKRGFQESGQVTGQTTCYFLCKTLPGSYRGVSKLSLFWVLLTSIM